MTNIVTFKDEQLELEVNISPEEDTVWLTQAQMVDLFSRDQSVIARHIRNIFKERELDEKSNMHFLHIANSDKPVKMYSLDVIISVGYRVKSPRGVLFRKWATNILKQYLTEGFAINEKRLAVLNKTVQIQSNIIGGLVGIDAEDVLKVVHEYSRSLVRYNVFVMPTKYKKRPVSPAPSAVQSVLPARSRFVIPQFMARTCSTSFLITAATCATKVFPLKISASC